MLSFQTQNHFFNLYYYVLFKFKLKGENTSTFNFNFLIRNCVELTYLKNEILYKKMESS